MQVDIESFPELLWNIQPAVDIGLDEVVNSLGTCSNTPEALQRPTVLDSKESRRFLSSTRRQLREEYNEFSFLWNSNENTLAKYEQSRLSLSVYYNIFHAFYSECIPVANWAFLFDKFAKVDFQIERVPNIQDKALLSNVVAIGEYLSDAQLDNKSLNPRKPQDRTHSKKFYSYFESALNNSYKAYSAKSTKPNVPIVLSQTIILFILDHYLSLSNWKTENYGLFQSSNWTTFQPDLKRGKFIMPFYKYQFQQMKIELENVGVNNVEIFLSYFALSILIPIRDIHLGESCFLLSQEDIQGVHNGLNRVIPDDLSHLKGILNLTQTAHNVGLYQQKKFGTYRCTENEIAECYKRSMELLDSFYSEINTVQTTINNAKFPETFTSYIMHIMISFRRLHLKLILPLSRFVYIAYLKQKYNPTLVELGKKSCLGSLTALSVYLKMCKVSKRMCINMENTVRYGGYAFLGFVRETIWTPTANSGGPDGYTKQVKLDICKDLLDMSIQLKSVDFYQYSRNKELRCHIACIEGEVPDNYNDKVLVIGKALEICAGNIQKQTNRIYAGHFLQRTTETVLNLMVPFKALASYIKEHFERVPFSITENTLYTMKEFCSLVEVFKYHLKGFEDSVYIQPASDLYIKETSNDFRGAILFTFARLSRWISAKCSDMEKGKANAFLNTSPSGSNSLEMVQNSTNKEMIEELVLKSKTEMIMAFKEYAAVASEKQGLMDEAIFSEEMPYIIEVLSNTPTDTPNYTLEEKGQAFKSLLSFMDQHCKTNMYFYDLRDNMEKMVNAL